MTDEQKQTLHAFAALKAEEAIIADKVDAMKKEVLDIILTSGIEEVEMEEGKIILSGTKKWTYPEAIAEAEANIKIAKKEAEQKGDATYTETKYVKFVSAKE